MKKNYGILLICLLAGSFVGCSDDEDGYNRREAFGKEQALIKDFVKDKNPTVFDYTYTLGGDEYLDYAYVFNHEVTGTKPKDGQFILYSYTQRTFAGVVLDATDMSLAIGEGIKPTFLLGGPICMQINPDPSKYIDPVSDCLKCISEGKSGNTIISSIMSFRNSYVYREYKIEKIIPEAKLLDYENRLIDQFLDTVKGLQKPILRVPLNEGNDTIARVALIQKNDAGVKVTSTDSVTVHASAYILDEYSTSRQFIKMKDDESVAWNLPSMVKGISLTVAQLHVGEEAYILLPSGMAYGFIGNFNRYTGQYSVPPYATILFKIKVISTKTNPKK